MKNVRTQFARLALTCAVLCAIGFHASAQTAVQRGGFLNTSTVGGKTYVCNSSGAPFSFAGVDLYWSQWDPKFWTASTVDYFVDNWKVSVIRCAVGVAYTPGPSFTTVAVPGGIVSDYATNKNKCTTIIDQAIKRGIYVIVDWHVEGKAQPFESTAKQFFKEIAQTYSQYPNIIYEVYNEPARDGNDQGAINAYDQMMVDYIRQYDKKNLIICGSNTWSQYPNQVSITGANAYNICYTFHAYPDNEPGHLTQFYNNVPDAQSHGKAVFITELSGKGSSYGNTATIMDKCKEWNIPVTTWEAIDNGEDWSIFCQGSGTSCLTPLGQMFKDRILAWGGSNPTPTCTTVNLPGTIQAESYCDMSGIQTENTSDSGGGQNVGWIDTGDWLSYSVNVPSTGSYLVQYRVASASGGGSIRLEKQGGTPLYGTISVPSTGGWQNWQTISHTVQLTAGTQNIAIAAQTGGFNINWISIAPTNPTGFSLTVQAESFSEMAGVQTESTTDAGGGLNVGWIDTNDWMKYSNITIPSTGSYLFEFRVASPNSNGVLSHDLNSGAVQLGTIGVPNTGGWQNWQTISKTVTLNAGTYNFGIFAATGGWNINWWRISKPGARLAISDDTETSEAISLYPNPAESTVHVRLTEDVKRVSVLDITGRELIVVEPNKQTEISINVDGLTRGIHFIKAEGNLVKVMRFSKQ